MTLKEYQQLALQTEKPMEPDRRRRHAELGIISEIGEIATIIKAYEVYGKLYDATHLKEEIGDLCWFVALYADVDGQNFWALQQKTKVTVNWLAITATSLFLHQVDVEELVSNIKGFCENYNFDFNEVLVTNIKKLRARYPEGYTDHDAIVRDKDAEKEAMDV